MDTIHVTEGKKLLEAYNLLLKAVFKQMKQAGGNIDLSDQKDFNDFVDGVYEVVLENLMLENADVLTITKDK